MVIGKVHVSVRVGNYACFYNKSFWPAGCALSFWGWGLCSGLLGLPGLSIKLCSCVYAKNAVFWDEGCLGFEVWRLFSGKELIGAPGPVASSVDFGSSRSCSEPELS